MIDPQPYGAGPIHDMDVRNDLIRGNAFYWDTLPALQGSRISRRRRLTRRHATAGSRQHPQRERPFKVLTETTHRETREKTAALEIARSA
jgi:hypothetical protein